MVTFKTDCLTCKTKNCSILKECEDSVLEQIDSHKITRTLRPGKKLFSEGDPVHGVYFIKKGLLKVELNGKKGRPVILKIVKQGTVFGHRINPRHKAHPYSVTAASETEYCYIPSRLFQNLIERNSSLRQQLFNEFLNELEFAEQKSVMLAHKSVREKIADALLMLAGLYDYQKKKLSFRIHLCRQDLADLTGTTKEQVSKTLQEFEQEGLIKCHAKKFNYLALDRLLTIANSPEPQRAPL